MAVWSHFYGNIVVDGDIKEAYNYLVDDDMLNDQERFIVTVENSTIHFVLDIRHSYGYSFAMETVARLLTLCSGLIKELHAEIKWETGYPQSSDHFNIDMVFHNETYS